MNACDPRLDGRAANARAPHLRAALNGTALGLLSFDPSLAVLFASRALHVLLEVDARGDEACTLPELLERGAALDQAQRSHLHEICLRAVALGREQRSMLTVASGAEPRVLRLQVAPLGDGSWMAVFEDVTASQKEATSALEQAMCDALTGLPSRQMFQRHFSAALAPIAAAGPEAAEMSGVAVMLVDLDRFKAVNDTLGHPVGDALLRLVGKRLQTMLRASDMVARLGGDEFALLAAPAPSRADLHRLALRLADVLGRPYLVEGHLINVGASIGVALAPQDARDCDQLLRCADLALYDVKRSGRSDVRFFRPEFDARAAARRALEIDLRKAMVLRQFELHYQPQIDLETNSVVGFEALLRWRHPERGLVSPADFIPLAEEIGLIVPLGEWVLREACCEAARWRSEVSVAVNVSPHQFEDTSRLVDSVGRALAASGLPGRRLEVEITESVLLRNEQAVLDALHRLRALDVRVAMDDFGTGYSSLSQLHSFPFDKIKIDRSFVRDRGDVAGQNAIIRAITSLGVSLGISTIAEGVETLDQLARIRTEGCTSVQGYLYSRPVPATQIERLMADLARTANPERDRIMEVSERV